MKIAYESWIKRISLGELIQRAIFKTLVQQQRLSAFHLMKFLSIEYNCQHGLYDKVISESGKPEEQTKQMKKERLASHIRLFLKSIPNNNSQSFISEQYSGGPYDQLTYGHAMNEFCFFRFHTKDFIIKRFKKFHTVQRVGIFNQVNNAINGLSQHCPTAAFFHEGTDKRDNKKINDKITRMIKEEME